MVIKDNNLVKIAVDAAEEKKARDIVLLEISDISPLCDYFLICSGNSSTQVQAIAENIKDKLKEVEEMPLRIEGLKDAHWVLMDYGTLVIHVFQDEDREFYNLERLWGDARVIETHNPTA